MGDSISSIQFVNRIRQKLNVKLAVKDIFTFKTARRISKLINSDQENIVEILSEQGLLEGESPLLAIQEWFFEVKDKELYPAFNHYNQSFFIKVPALDIALVKLSIINLLEHHDVLRMTFTHDDQNKVYKQYYRNEVPLFLILKLLM